MTPSNEPDPRRYPGHRDPGPRGPEAGDPGPGGPEPGDPGPGDPEPGDPGPGDPAPGGRVPIRGHWGSHPIPDLRRIPADDWESALRAAHPRARMAAAEGLGTRGTDRVMILAGMLTLEDDERADRLAEVADRPRGLPGARPPRPASPRSRQVNFRVSGSDYERLAHAARLLGLRPTAAARLMALRGARQVVDESRR